MDEVPSVAAACEACRPGVHEACTGCKGCGCLRSAQATAAKGPALPDPATYRGCP